MIDLNKLEEEQVRLAKKAVIRDSFEKIGLIGGIDCSYLGNKVIAAIVVCDSKTLEVKEEVSAMTETKIPYISGFLSYREAPAIGEAFAKIKTKPDMLLVDGNGILHPRKCGIATHIGVLFDMPTIGVAKKLLLGEVKNNKVYVEDEPRAELVYSREHAKPLYVSPGNKVSLKTSVKIAKDCLRFPHKLPEPLHLAHRFAEKSKENVVEE